MKGSSSPNDTPKPRKKLRKRPFFDSADRHEQLYGRSRLYASAQGRHETGGVLSLFSRLSSDISIQNSVQRWSSDFQGLFRVKIRKMAQGSDDLSTLPLKLTNKFFFPTFGLPFPPLSFSFLFFFQCFRSPSPSPLFYFFIFYSGTQPW